jgi:hypothetical protein
MSSHLLNLYLDLAFVDDTSNQPIWSVTWLWAFEERTKPRARRRQPSLRSEQFSLPTEPSLRVSANPKYTVQAPPFWLSCQAISKRPNDDMELSLGGEGIKSEIIIRSPDEDLPEKGSL